MVHHYAKKGENYMKLSAFNEESLQRLEIVRFYLIMKQFEELGDNIYTQTIIETICQMGHIKITNVNFATEKIKYHEKPRAFEYGILHYLFRIPYRTLCSLGHVAAKTIVNQLTNYIENEYQYPLINTFNPEITETIINFNKTYARLFKHSSYLSKGV